MQNHDHDHGQSAGNLKISRDVQMCIRDSRSTAQFSPCFWRCVVDRSNIVNIRFKRCAWAVCLSARSDRCRCSAYFPEDGRKSIRAAFGKK